MKLGYWQTQGNTRFAPEFKIPLGMFDVKIDSSIPKLLLEKESQLKKSINYQDVDGGIGAKDSLTGRFHGYNLLEWPEMNSIKTFFKNSIVEYFKFTECPITDDLYIQCWYNTIRNSEGIDPHSHDNTPDCMISGNLTVSVDPTSNSFTYYQIGEWQDPLKIKNEPGVLTIFPSWITHGTNVYEGNDVRLSIAFDLVSKTTYGKLKDQRKYIKFPLN